MSYIAFLITLMALLSGAWQLNASAHATDDLRIERPRSQTQSHFRQFPNGYADRWLRNLRNPTYCRMLLCHGTCASPMRAAFSPSNLGMRAVTDLTPEPNPEVTFGTPCSIKRFDHLMEDLIRSENLDQSSCASMKSN
jgi:hypothetical protein